MTNKRPDLVLVDRPAKRLMIIELTIPFDTNVNAAHARKCERYEDLLLDLEDAGYNPSYHAREIGSRGLISSDNISRLKEIVSSLENQTTKDINSFLNNLKRIVIIASYIVFHSKYEQSWINPNFVTL